MRKRIEKFIAVQVTKTKCYTRALKHFQLDKANPGCKVCHGTGTEGWVGVTLEDAPAVIRLACRKCMEEIYQPIEEPPSPEPEPIGRLQRIWRAVRRALKASIPFLR